MNKKAVASFFSPLCRSRARRRAVCPPNKHSLSSYLRTKRDRLFQQRVHRARLPVRPLQFGRFAPHRFLGGQGRRGGRQDGARGDHGAARQRFVRVGQPRALAVGVFHAKADDGGDDGAAGDGVGRVGFFGGFSFLCWGWVVGW
jgi:hypothetical protein